MDTQATFRPWIPRRFDGTLILGESTFRGKTAHSRTGWGHHFDIGFPREFICKHVGDNLLNDVGTFRKLRGAFSPVLPPNEFWERKAFTNFIPELLNSSRDRPTEDQWHKGQREFELILDEVHPQRILVVGNALWENLPSAENETSVSRIYRRNILAMPIPHPSWWNRAKPRPYTTLDARRVTVQLMRHSGAEKKRSWSRETYV